jgi:CHASE3 domain sensor protein
MDTTLIIGLLVIGAIALSIYILRSVLRINEIVANQQKQIKATQQLIEVMKNIRDKVSGDFTDFKKI